MADLLCGWGMEKRGEISFMPQSYYVQFLNFYMCWWLVACAVHLNGNRKRHTIEYDCMCNEYFMHASQPANDRMSESCVCVQHIEVQIEIERWLAIFRFEIRRVPSHNIYIYMVYARSHLCPSTAIAGMRYIYIVYCQTIIVCSV